MQLAVSDEVIRVHACLQRLQSGGAELAWCMDGPGEGSHGWHPVDAKASQLRVTHARSQVSDQAGNLPARQEPTLADQIIQIYVQRLVGPVVQQRDAPQIVREWRACTPSVASAPPISAASAAGAKYVLQRASATFLGCWNSPRRIGSTLN